MKCDSLLTAASDGESYMEVVCIKLNLRKPNFIGNDVPLIWMLPFFISSKEISKFEI